MEREPGFLGRGWAFPPEFSDGGAEVAMVSGGDDVRQSVQIILSTTPGERVMQGRFGCDLRSLQFEEIDQRALNAVRSMVTNALLWHEPRIDTERVDVDQRADEPGCIQIRVTYVVRSTNTRYNLVFPFYVQEALHLAR